VRRRVKLYPTMPIRPNILFQCIAIGLLSGCGAHYTESQLLGSWQLESHATDARITYYPDHNWVMTVTSNDPRVESGAGFGVWRLEGNQLSTVTLSTLGNEAVSSREVAKITRLTDSSLVWERGSKAVNFRRTSGSAAALSDTELTRRLEGTWRHSSTNSTRSVGTSADSLYRADGYASWHGTAYDVQQAKPLPRASGAWYVNNGQLVTTITNAEPGLKLPKEETRDELILVTDSQFTYRDARGNTHKALRVP
jgi:hypothetical protein